jgi:hypothetical protein
MLVMEVVPVLKSTICKLISHLFICGITDIRLSHRQHRYIREPADMGIHVSLNFLDQSRRFSSLSKKDTIQFHSIRDGHQLSIIKKCATANSYVPFDP